MFRRRRGRRLLCRLGRHRYGPWYIEGPCVLATYTHVVRRCKGQRCKAEQIGHIDKEVTGTVTKAPLPPLWVVALAVVLWELTIYAVFLIGPFIAHLIKGM